MLVREIVALLEREMKVLFKGALDANVEGLAYHSAKVVPGGLFAALPGSKENGTRYVSQALDNGARIILYSLKAKENLKELPANTASLGVEDVRQALALIADVYYKKPSKQMTMIGLTGTNGKTTMTYMVESISRTAGLPCGVVGTIEYRLGSFAVSAERTTPEAPDLQEILSIMVEKGAKMVAMEVSSHALVQKRIDGTNFDFGLFANLSQDHLDYHKDMENYYQAKKRLFTDWDLKASIINMDDQWGRRLASEIGGEVITYGQHPDCHIRPREIIAGEKGLEVSLEVPGGLININSKLVGEHNVPNIIAAAALGWRIGFPHEAISEGLAALKEIPGRFQKVSGKDEPLVIVDYAHTPDALEKLLDSARNLASGRLILVFGCGGDRDRLKRPLMGEVASKNADITFITSDNPRSENPENIIEAIVTGYRGIRKNDYRVISDRQKAIFQAVAEADHDDVVVIAGKGHENYQLFLNDRIHFDDREIARQALKELRRIES